MIVITFDRSWLPVPIRDTFSLFLLQRKYLHVITEVNEIESANVADMILHIPNFDAKNRDIMVSSNGKTKHTVWRPYEYG